DGSARWWTERYNRSGDGVSVQEQDGDASSLLAWYRDLLALRQQRPELRHGSQSLPCNRQAQRGGRGHRQRQQPAGEQAAVAAHERPQRAQGTQGRLGWRAGRRRWLRTHAAMLANVTCEAVPARAAPVWRAVAAAPARAGRPAVRAADSGGGIRPGWRALRPAGPSAAVRGYAAAMLRAPPGRPWWRAGC